jgi:hypothetical protein
MRKNAIVWFVLIATIAMVSPSCQDESYVRFTANSPKYLSYDDLRNGVEITEQQALKNPGKIYFKDNYIFINEQREGVHVYDNSNPANPSYVTFIKIPGNVDIVIRNNYLYADSYIDLVVLDISNIGNPIEKERVTNAFQYVLPEYDQKYELAEINREKGVVVGWEIKEVRQRINYSPVYYPVFYREMAFDGAVNYSGKTGSSGSSSGGETFGVGGSMARFGQFSNYLLTLSGQNQLKTYKTEADGKLSVPDSMYIAWGIETMFILHETLFIGGQNGMYIYSLSNLPSVNYISQFNHFTACDPVVADDKFAYVTLRSGSGCGRAQNVLDVIDISNIKSPVLKNTYQMTGPQGLGKDGQLLFICDGKAGLKVYDATQPDKTITLLAHFPNIDAFDVIPLQGSLFMIGSDGFYQYSYSNINDIKQISFIPVVKE